MRDMVEKMAELQFEAPLARFDGDEWNEFHDFTTSADLENSNNSSTTSAIHHNQNNKNQTNATYNQHSTTGTDNKPQAPDPQQSATSSVVDNFSETFSGSLEDLVNTFDEKITKCFFNYEESVEKLAPVQIRSQEDIMRDCQMWWTITGNFGNILPIDWSKTYARQLQEQALHLREKRERDSPELDLSDDEELQQAFDMHSLIISSLQQEPLFTADEVIQQIEGMMEDSPSPGSTPSGSDGFSVTSSEFLQLRERIAISGITVEDSLKNLSISALNELYGELECTIREYSETLIQQLAHRDELEYEKELKNHFISLLLNVQKRRKETQQGDKQRKAAAATTTSNPTTASTIATTASNALSNINLRKPKAPPPSNEVGTYVTTVIPYHQNQGPPTNKQLAIYNKILTAINDDSPSVPSLLTDYILKVLCPTT